MQGKVIADKLNVRNRPELKGKTIGLLSKDEIVDILGKQDNWIEIRYNGGSAFVYGDYIESMESVSSMKGKVKPALLNVREQPDLTSAIIGSLVKGTLIDVLAQHSEWLEIEFNDSLAFIHRDYVELLEASLDAGVKLASARGKISADILNVRKQPKLDGDLVGKLTRDTVVNLISKIGNWYEIMFNGSPAYIHEDYVEPASDLFDEMNESTPGAPPIPSPSREEEPKEPAEVKLIPSQKLKVSGSSTDKKVARTWNQFGNLLTSLSDKSQIDPASAVAVLCVESSGKGFEKNNKDRMIIRFENHKFWSYWGKDNTDVFHKHFKYGEKKSGKVQVWLGHYWRKNEKDEWQAFHGNQVKEWEVLDFACSLDDTAALNSISMGAPQIMGFHHQRIGYSTVQEMFEKFNRDIRFQIKGLFDFFDNKMIGSLRKLDFVTFAGSYNGSGQKEKYGKWIQDHYNAFKNLG